MAPATSKKCYLATCMLMFHLATSVAEFNLLLLHTNDVHDRIEETNKYSGACSASDSAAGNCYGGVARMKTMVDQMRSQHPNSIFLNAGDEFQGTLWFYYFLGLANARFMNHLGYDAMAVGNHEFDNGVSGLVPFVDALNFPILSANADFSRTPRLDGKIKKSTVLNVNGTRIGVIGYTTTDTPYISSPETVTFTDVLAAVQAEADRLTDEGIKIIIAVGHAGFTVDRQIAEQLRNVDIIVGGHTNTFLYTGDAPSNESPAGAYPYRVGNILIVQDYAYGKYLGALVVNFDDDGVVISTSGNPILLDSSVAQDNGTLKIMNEYLPELEAMKNEVVGYSHVFFESDYRIVRTQESSLGNLVTDAWVFQNLRHSDSRYWSDVGIAMVNSGGIRAPISPGNITVEHVVAVSPFRNTVNIVELKGSTVMAVLEHSAAGWSKEDGSHFGGWLQFSGIRVMYDMRRDIGSRVVDVQMLCTKCLTPKYEPLNATEVYMILTSSFISAGGDGYGMIPRELIREHLIGNVDADLLIQYISATSPLMVGLEGRIRFLEEYERTNLGRVGLHECVPDGTTTAFSAFFSGVFVSTNIMLAFFLKL